MLTSLSATGKRYIRITCFSHWNFNFHNSLVLSVRIELTLTDIPSQGFSTKLKEHNFIG